MNYFVFRLKNGVWEYMYMLYYKHQVDNLSLCCHPGGWDGYHVWEQNGWAFYDPNLRIKINEYLTNLNK